MEKKIQEKWKVEFTKWSNESLCLEAVKQDGDALRYVKDQTEAVCLEAVKENSDALQYVKNQKIFMYILETL